MRRFAIACFLMLASLFVAAPRAEAATAADVAQALRSRIWWQDLGSFGSQTWGYVHVFGPAAGGGWYTGTRVTVKGSYGSVRLGFAYRPFVLSNGTMGVVIDRTTSREVFTITGYDPATERLVLQSGSRRVVWSSTRSSYTPYRIRRLYYF